MPTCIGSRGLFILFFFSSSMCIYNLNVSCKRHTREAQHRTDFSWQKGSRPCRIDWLTSLANTQLEIRQLVTVSTFFHERCERLLRKESDICVKLRSFRFLFLRGHVSILMAISRILPFLHRIHRTYPNLCFFRIEYSFFFVWIRSCSSHVVDRRNLCWLGLVASCRR